MLLSAVYRGSGVPFFVSIINMQYRVRNVETFVKTLEKSMGRGKFGPIYDVEYH
jgi:hypothetical protein